MIRRLCFCAIALATGPSCYGMEGLCVATQNLRVTIPEREFSPGGVQDFLRHMEPEAIADMYVRGEVKDYQLRKLPPQDQECVAACVKSHVVWDGNSEGKMLSKREKSLVKTYLKKLIVEKVRLSANEENRKSVFEEVKTKPEWLRLMFARCFFLQCGSDIGKYIGLFSIGTFKTKILVAAGILAKDWSLYRPDELPCCEYMEDFK